MKDISELLQRKVSLASGAELTVDLTVDGETLDQLLVLAHNREWVTCGTDDIVTVTVSDVDSTYDESYREKAFHEVEVRLCGVTRKKTGA